MSIVMDIFLWLFIDTVLGFLFYLTGCVILKVLTFGYFEIKFKDFSDFKANKAKNVNLIMLLGFSFYALLIVLVAYSNH
jgi:hypothetical protein